MEENVKKQLDELRGTANGQALLLYLAEEKAKMVDIKCLTPENFKGKQEAVEIIDRLFRFLEKKEFKNQKTKYN
jgi:hypothetical protein